MAEVGVWNKDENGNDVWKYGEYEITVHRFDSDRNPLPYIYIQLYCGIDTNSMFYWDPQCGDSFDIDGDFEGHLPIVVCMEFCKTVERVREALSIQEALTNG